MLLIIGSMGTSLVINVLSDTDPELDEMFQIQLVSVSESNQALSPQSSNATITVLRNDNPEGTFLFPNASLGPHIIQENVNDPVNLTIQRVGGALTSERILHQAAPSSRSSKGELHALYRTYNICMYVYIYDICVHM